MYELEFIQMSNNSKRKYLQINYVKPTVSEINLQFHNYKGKYTILKCVKNLDITHTLEGGYNKHQQTNNKPRKTQENGSQ